MHSNSRCQQLGGDNSLKEAERLASCPVTARHAALASQRPSAAGLPGVACRHHHVPTMLPPTMFSCANL